MPGAISSSVLIASDLWNATDMDSSVRLDIDLSKIKEKGTITFIVKGRAVPWQCGPRLWLIRNLHTEQERGKRTANSSCRCHLRPLLWESPTGKRQQLDLSVKKPSPTPLTPSAPPLCPQRAKFNSSPPSSSTPAPFPFTRGNHTLHLEPDGFSLTEPWSNKDRVRKTAKADIHGKKGKGMQKSTKLHGFPILTFVMLNYFEFSFWWWKSSIFYTLLLLLLLLQSISTFTWTILFCVGWLEYLFSQIIRLLSSFHKLILICTTLRDAGIFIYKI